MVWVVRVWAAALVVALLGLVSQPAAAQEALPLYRYFHCFQFVATVQPPPRDPGDDTPPPPPPPVQPGRVCVTWEVDMKMEGSLTWSIMVSDLAMRKTYFRDSLVMPPQVSQAWLAALEKGLEWAPKAEGQKVEARKLITEVEGISRIYFVSRAKGKDIAVVFFHDKWMLNGPIGMPVEYAPDELKKNSLQSFIKDLKAARERMDLRRQKVIEQRKIFQ